MFSTTQQDMLQSQLMISLHSKSNISKEREVCIMGNLPVSAYIDIAPNEYLTKYSFNRNFEKLLSNDVYLYHQYSANEAASTSIDEHLKNLQTYNMNKTYSAGECVFYKIQKSDTRFYILSAIQGPNTHKPLVRKNLNTGDLYVVNGDWWVIVGIKPNKGNALPKDLADNYINESQASFASNHQDNTELTAHPSGKLGLQNSTKTFITLENLDDDRKTLLYPDTMTSLVADRTILDGYMRKWPNGLLEYDVTFRLGYISSDENGIDLLTANNFVVDDSPNNFMYFKEPKDYEIFKDTGEFYAVTSQSKQTNLNTSMNAYSGKLVFPEKFKDLNYMVFTSNMKNVETEAYSLNSNVVSSDSRLVMNGLEIVGTKKNANFTYKCIIPNEAVNIANGALANIYSTNNLPIVLEIDPNDSKLANIDANAFFGTEIQTINIPHTVRYIGTNAFANCMELTSVNIYVDPTSLAHQVRIDSNAFCNKVKEVHIYIKNNSLQQIFAMYSDAYSHEDAFLNDTQLSDKFLDPDFRVFIGMDVDVSCYVNGEYYPPINSSQLSNDIQSRYTTAFASRAKSMAMMANSIRNSSQINDNDILDSASNSISIDIEMGSDYKYTVSDTVSSVTLNFDYTPNSCIVSSATSLSDMRINGTAYCTMLLSSFLHMPSIAHLVIEDVAIVGDYAFSSVKEVKNLVVNTSLSSTVLQPYSFSGMHIDTMIMHIAHGEVFQQAFNNTHIGTLCIDLASKPQLYANALSGLTTNQIVFCNMPSCGCVTNIFHYACFNGLSAHQLVFDINISSLTSMKSNMFTVENMKLLMLEDGTMIRGTDKSLFWTHKDEMLQYIDANEQFFIYDNQNTILKANIRQIASSRSDTIDIPYGVIGIADNAFNVKQQIKKQSILSSLCVKKVHIPSTVTKIGNNAFKGFWSIEQFEFDDASAIESIGSQAFGMCNNLIGFAFEA